MGILPTQVDSDPGQGRNVHLCNGIGVHPGRGASRYCRAWGVLGESQELLPQSSDSLTLMGAKPTWGAYRFVGPRFREGEAKARPRAAGDSDMRGSRTALETLP